MNELAEQREQIKIWNQRRKVTEEKGLTQFNKYREQFYKPLVSNSLVADIRNKLTPIKNLCKMLKRCEHRFSDNEKLHELILTEIDNTEKCIEYLSNL